MDGKLFKLKEEQLNNNNGWSSRPHSYLTKMNRYVNMHYNSPLS